MWVMSMMASSLQENVNMSINDQIATRLKGLRSQITRNEWFSVKEPLEALVGTLLAELSVQREAANHWFTEAQHDHNRVEKLLAEIAEKDKAHALYCDNVEIDRQQTLQRIEKAGELLEQLAGWPSPNAAMNIARDIGRVLQGKPAKVSSGVEEALGMAGVFTLSWKQKLEAAEARALAAEQRLLTFTEEVCHVEKVLHDVSSNGLARSVEPPYRFADQLRAQLDVARHKADACNHSLGINVKWKCSRGTNGCSAPHEKDALLSPSSGRTP